MVPTNTASTMYESVLESPAAAMEAAAARVRVRFFGLTAASRKPRPSARGDLIDCGHPLRHRWLFVAPRATSPRSDPDEDRHQAEDQEQPSHPHRRPAVLAGTGRVGHEQDDHADQAKTYQPAEQERDAVALPYRGREHEYDRDDRDRADRHTDSGREYFSYR